MSKYVDIFGEICDAIPSHHITSTEIYTPNGCYEFINGFWKPIPVGDTVICLNPKSMRAVQINMANKQIHPFREHVSLFHIRTGRLYTHHDNKWIHAGEHIPYGSHPILTTNRLEQFVCHRPNPLPSDIS